MMWIRPVAIVITSNKTLDELLKDNRTYSEQNKIALKNRIVQIRMDAYDK